MTQQDFANSLKSFFETYGAPKVTNESRRWELHFILEALSINYGVTIQTVYKFLSAFGILNAQGEFDLDVIEKCGRAAFAKVPTYHLWLFDLHASDFESFISHLRG